MKGFGFKKFFLLFVIWFVIWSFFSNCLILFCFFVVLFFFGWVDFREFSFWSWIFFVILNFWGVICFECNFWVVREWLLLMLDGIDELNFWIWILLKFNKVFVFCNFFINVLYIEFNFGICFCGVMISFIGVEFVGLIVVVLFFGIFC